MGAQRERGGQRRIARGAAEYFMVMDVPHGVLVCGVFGGKAGGFEEGRGLFGAPACILTVCGKNAGRGCSCGFLKDSSHLGKRGVTEEPEKRGSGAARPPGTFYFCSLCCKECSTNGVPGLLGLPLDFPHHNGRNILTKLPCVTNLYITHAHVNT